MNFHGFWLASMVFQGGFMFFCGFWLVFMVFQGDFTVFNGFWLITIVFQGIFGFSWFLVGFHGNHLEKPWKPTKTMKNHEKP